MKSIKFTVFWVALVFLFQVSTVLACHKGASMGFASEDPLNASLDYSYGSTFMSASTSGSLGCKNWDLVKNNRVEYLDKTWNALAEQVSQGKGGNI